MPPTNKKNSNRRPNLPGATETQVLVRGRRRCCLCSFLNSDFSIKRVQIAHIDKNPANNKYENLVALCLFHHDEYDSVTSQSKGITADEIKYYRAELDKVWEKQNEQLQTHFIGITQLEDGSDSKVATPSARLLGEVLTAFDNEMLRARIGKYTGRPTGIVLAKWGRIAIEEDGDFDVAIEALLSLIRLATAAPPTMNGDMRTHENLPLMTPALSAVQLLQYMAKDWRLLREAANRVSLLALIGDSPFSALSHYTKIPDPFWRSVVDILYHAAKFSDLRNIGWAVESIVGHLAELLVGIGLANRSCGVNLPEPPCEIRITAADFRGIEEGQAKALLPYVYLSNKIAMLPQDLFDVALSRMTYHHPVSKIIVAPDHWLRLDKESAIEAINSWSVRTGFEGTTIAVDDGEIRAECDAILQEKSELGRSVTAETKNFLMAERDCVVNQRYFREGCTHPRRYTIDPETDKINWGL